MGWIISTNYCTLIRLTSEFKSSERTYLESDHRVNPRTTVLAMYKNSPEIKK